MKPNTRTNLMFLLIGGKLTALEICKFIIKCSLNTLKNRISLPISFLESDLFSARQQQIQKTKAVGYFRKWSLKAIYIIKPRGIRNIKELFQMRNTYYYNVFNNETHGKRQLYFFE